jgi:LmbE family N-acetylglucosaminyl deacetylase
VTRPRLAAGEALAAPRWPEIWLRPPAGRVLCFAPHPDDEVAGPGGALALHRRLGDPVRVVVATDGGAGDPDRRFDPAGYAAARRAESSQALGLLGVTDVRFWGFPDGAVVTGRDLAEVAARAAAETAELRPEVVYLPWDGELHADHLALHLGVLDGLRQCSFAGTVLAYEIWSAMLPDALLDISTVADAKWRALGCYGTQLAYFDLVAPIRGLNTHRGLLAPRGTRFAEAYRRQSLR